MSLKFIYIRIKKYCSYDSIVCTKNGAFFKSPMDLHEQEPFNYGRRLSTELKYEVSNGASAYCCYTHLKRLHRCNKNNCSWTNKYMDLTNHESFTCWEMKRFNKKMGSHDHVNCLSTNVRFTKKLSTTYIAFPVLFKSASHIDKLVFTDVAKSGPIILWPNLFLKEWRRHFLYRKRYHYFMSKEMAS